MRGTRHAYIVAYFSDAFFKHTLLIQLFVVEHFLFTVFFFTSDHVFFIQSFFIIKYIIFASITGTSDSSKGSNYK